MDQRHRPAIRASYTPLEHLEPRVLFAAAGHYSPVPSYYPNGGAARQDLAVADMNGDHRPDLIVSNHFHNTVNILLNRGGGRFSGPRKFTAGVNLNSVAVSDFNGDGRNDIAVAGVDMAVFFGTGDGRVDVAHPVHFGNLSAPQTVVIADFNRDQKPDLAVTESTGAALTVVLNKGNSAFGAAKRVAAGEGPTGMVAADVNNDANRSGRHQS